MYFKTKLCQTVPRQKDDPRLESGLGQGLILCLSDKKMYGAQPAYYLAGTWILHRG
jgi:hypothetical protein